MKTPETIAKELAMLKRKDSNECEQYFRGHALSMDSSNFLILTHDTELILLYARYHSFDSFNELELVKLNMEDLMLEYIRLRRILWADAEVALVESKMIKAVKAILEYSVLSERAEVALLKKGNGELIKFYEQKWDFRSREGKNLRLRM